MSFIIKTVMLVIRELLALVFPLSDDERQIARCSPAYFQSKLAVRTKQSVIVLSQFKDPDVRAAVHLVKFHRHASAIELTASLLRTWLEAHAFEPVVIIPIPLSKKRLRERGYNQAELIARAAVTGTQHVVKNDVLSRVRHTPPQTTLTKTDRLQNMRDAFAAANHPDIKNMHIILFDDVVTTGATLAAAKATLLPLQPQSIRCVALAG